MRNNILTAALSILFVAAYGTGFNIKTSSVISQPNTEVLGEYQGSWYVIGFEKPGNMNKPPQYQIFRYSTGFSDGKISKLYPSFGEKTLYLKSVIMNNKISMFYGRCEKREDEAAMMEKKEGRAVIPVIERQDFDLNTLEPVGDAVVVFNHNDEFFTASGIDIVQSEDKSKVAVVVKPYEKYQKYKVLIGDNTSNSESAHTYSFKDLKEYLRFVSAGVSNTGQVYMVTQVREDILGYRPDKKTEGPAFHLFSVNKDSKEPVKAEYKPGGDGSAYVDDPKLSVLGSGSVILACDRFADKACTILQGIAVAKYDASLSSEGSRNIEPSEQLIPMMEQYHKTVKGNAFANVELQRILPLDGENFMLLTEYHARTNTAVADKNITVVERSFIISYRVDAALAVKKQNFIHKKQISSLVDYAFSAQAYRKGNDVYLFYNDNWENDEEHNMNLKCTRLPATGDSETKKVLNTSGDFFTSMTEVFFSGDKVLFQENRIVDYGDVTKEVKLLEVTIE